MPTISFMATSSIEKLGAKLSRLRNKAGLSYSEVGRRVEKSTNTIRDIESGSTKEPSIVIIRKLADLYEVPIDWLTDDSSDWPPPETNEQKAVSMVEAALTGAGLSGELTEDDREVLRLYRLLADEMKRKAEGYLIGLVHGGTVDAAKFGAEINHALNQVGNDDKQKQ